MMAWVDPAVLVVLALHVFPGIRKGFLVSLLGVAGLVCAVVAGHVWAAPVGDLLREHFGVDPLVVNGLGGALVFLSVTMIFSAVTGVIRCRRRRRDKEEGGSSLSVVSRMGGGVIGLVMGMVFVAVLLWTYDALRGGLPRLGLPDVAASHSATLVREAVDAGARLLLAGRMEEGQSAALASAISTPGDSVQHLAALLEEPVVHALLRDPAIRDDVLSGDTERIAENHAFSNVMADTNVTGRLLDMGLVAEPYDPLATGTRWAGQLAAVGSRLDDVLRDPEVAEALEGLREEGVFEEENWKALLMDPRARRIAWEILDPAEDDFGTPPTESIPTHDR